MEQLLIFIFQLISDNKKSFFINNTLMKFLRSYNNTIFFICCLILIVGCSKKIKAPIKIISKNKTILTDDTILRVGAEQLDLYLPILKNKNIALVVNHTSLINSTHLADTLLKLNIVIKKIFSPEHGFRGEADAGETVKNSVDIKTNLPLISLYGKNKKPSQEQLNDIDIIIFDMQDVGARFYTYSSTMHYVMETCAEQKKKVIILDRPNPNGEYIDGPVLDLKYKSFVGLNPIPIIHGLTLGEMALMINGEGWLKDNVKCDLEIIKIKNYKHHQKYILPIRPSPNLPNQQSIKLYPSLCLFEGTVISVGRGTDFPFQVLGGVDSTYGNFTFTPQSNAGNKAPLNKNTKCFGLDFRNEVNTIFTLKFLIEFYQKCIDKPKFFNKYFDTLAGTDSLRKQIIEGLTEQQIKTTWQANLEKYKILRKKYLLYGE